MAKRKIDKKKGTDMSDNKKPEEKKPDSAAKPEAAASRAFPVQVEKKDPKAALDAWKKRHGYIR